MVTVMERRLLWTVVVILLCLQVLDLWESGTPEPPRDATGDGLQQLAERMASIEERLARGTASAGPTAETVAVRTPMETTDGLGEQVARLDERLLALEGVGGQTGSTTTEPGVIRKLNSAIARDDLDEVQQLLAAGVDINARDDDRQTPLAAAAIAGRVEVIDLLIAEGADLERTSGRRTMTPLLASLDAVQEDAALVLLERGGDPEAVDKNGESALIWAAFNGTERVVQHLLAAGVKVDFQAHDGNSALADAARRGHLAIVRSLIANGATVNLRDKAGRTALTQAVEAGHDEVAELLRQHGAVR